MHVIVTTAQISKHSYTYSL